MSGVTLSQRRTTGRTRRSPVATSSQSFSHFTYRSTGDANPSSFRSYFKPEAYMNTSEISQDTTTSNLTMDDATTYVRLVPMLSRTPVLKLAVKLGPRTRTLFISEDDGLKLLFRVRALARATRQKRPRPPQVDEPTRDPPPERSVHVDLLPCEPSSSITPSAAPRSTDERGLAQFTALGRKRRGVISTSKVATNQTRSPLVREVQNASMRRAATRLRGSRSTCRSRGGAGSTRVSRSTPRSRQFEVVSFLVR